MPDGKKIQVTTTYSDRFLIRQLPGANYHQESQTWRVPCSWAACVTMRGLFGTDLEIGPELISWASAQRESRIGPAMMLRSRLELDDEALSVDAIREVNEHISKVERDWPGKQGLFTYQRVDVAFLSIMRHAILANPMGTGKSASTIRALQVLWSMGEDPFPALVICPNTVKLTWAGEIEAFAPGLMTSVIAGGASARRKALNRPAHIYIINWEALRIHSRLTSYGAMALEDHEKMLRELNKMDFRTVIADEMHRSKEPHSKQTRAMWAVIQPAAFRFGLTGTPVVNNVGDLWSLLHAVEPEGFPAKTRYLDRWAKVELGFYGGAEILGLRAETAGEFRAVTDPFIRRIPKAAALPWLPEKMPAIYRYTEMSPAQSRLYRQMEQEMVVMMRDEAGTDGIVPAGNAIAQLTRLLQFASASARAEFYTEKDHETGEERQRQRVILEMPSSKVEDLVNLLGEMGEDPLVVAAVSSQLIMLAAARLDKAGITYGLITGAQSGEERQAAVEAFQAGKIRVMLMTIDAGGEGITLTRASTILFMQRHWSTVKNSQCEDRLHRIGQKNCVQVIDQVTPGTVEFRKIQIIREKDVRIEEILRDKEMFSRLLGMI